MSFPLLSECAYLHPVLTSEESQVFEGELFRGNEALQWKAMNHAGRSIADQALLDIREVLGDAPIHNLLLLVGKGHNGGDAIIAARHLLNRFPDAKVKMVFPSGLSHLRLLAHKSLDAFQVSHGEQLKYLSLRQGSKDGVEAQIQSFLGSESIDLCLDGILGMQFKPPLRSPIKELIECVNALESIQCRIAVDVPSGVGDNSDETRFRADFSYATGIAKRGMFELQNRPAVGRIRYLDLGFFRPSNLYAKISVLSDGALGFRKALRKSQVHKKKFGHVFVLGGSAAMPGAILMTVRAAVKSGVGLVTAFVPNSIVAEAASQIPEAMWCGLPEIPEDGGLALEGLSQVRELADKATAWAIGPGMGRNPETATLIEEVLRLSRSPVLLDADALLPELVKMDWSNRACAITPHNGEFNRLLDRPLNDPVGIHDLRNFSHEFSCIALLKGSPTAIVVEDRVVYSCFGSPVLARGGSGDILAGLIGGRLAIPGANSVESVLQGAAWHGWSADRLARTQGQTSAKATEVLDFL